MVLGSRVDLGKAPQLIASKRPAALMNTFSPNERTSFLA
jgi:hypothetical protein